MLSPPVRAALLQCFIQIDLCRAAAPARGRKSMPVINETSSGESQHAPVQSYLLQRAAVFSGLSNLSKSVPHIASSNPSAPPRIASSSALGQQLPDRRANGSRPSAERTAISLCAYAERASNRLATFAQAISSHESDRAEQDQQRTSENAADHLLLKRIDNHTVAHV